MNTKQASLLDGSRIAAKHLELAKQKIAGLSNAGKKLTLGTIQIGQSKDATIYSNYLKRILGGIGIQYQPALLSENAIEKDVLEQIRKFNQDAAVTGIMIFAPLPKHLDSTVIFDHISAAKDVEGRTFLKSHFGVFSPTAHSVMALIDETGVDLKGKEAVVVGHSDLVGKPTAVLLMDRFATVTVCHKETKDLASHLAKADIVVVAVGKAHVIKGEWIKPGAVVIDVGENTLDGKIVGDVEFETARQRAAFISPVPGGVGPLTNVMLICNLIRMAETKNGNR